VLFAFSYNATHWAWTEFARYALPGLPFVLISLADWFPARRLVLWPLGGLMAVLAAASALNARQALNRLLEML
jgi:hypothetical protein